MAAELARRAFCAPLLALWLVAAAAPAGSRNGAARNGAGFILPDIGKINPAPFLAASFLAPFLEPAGAVEEIVVTGTRLAAPPGSLPGAGTVLDREAIEARGDSGVADLLRAVPGLHVVQPGAGGVSQLFMRGSEPNFTVFLVDGIKVNDPSNSRGGSFDFASLNLADLDRVEIVRGPESSIYGSDGLAGVINFISPAGGGPLAAAVEGEAGADDYRRASLQLSGPAGDGGFSLQATSRNDGEAVPGSTYEADSISGRLRLQPASGVTANLYGRYADTESTSFPEQSGGPRLAVLRSLDQASAEDYALGGDFDWQLDQSWSIQARASHYGRDSRYDSPGIYPGDQVPPNGAHNELRREQAALQATLAASAGSATLAATAGADFQGESGDSDGYVDFGPMRIPNSFALDRDTIGLFVEGRLQAGDRWLLQVSLRRDDPDGFAGETTGRLGASYSPNAGRTRLRADWGSGFKLPSFFALGSPLVGEPGLRPEKSRGAELGLTQQLGRVGEATLTLFDYEFEDLIDLDPATFRNVNRDRVSSRGAELGATLLLAPALTLGAHATWTDIDVAGSDRELLQRPEWRGGLSARWLPAADWSVDLDWLYVGDSLDNSIPTGELRLGAWQRVDLNLAWAVTPRLRLALAVDNLLDASYEEAIGFPAAGIRPRLAARYRFGD